ncbi:hypothetical protein WA026_013844 [Henosepilachna vigintioctopunctata]|uniref:Uncharacterized protein n=1 Tax=Henosepilachna vigintioctopunctata TaxID=420089 RepID=A0AAW1UZR6_9CUCU
MAEIINLNNHSSTPELSIVEETIQNGNNSRINKEKQSQKVEEWQVKRNRRLLKFRRIRLGTCKVNENDTSTENKFTGQERRHGFL